MKEASDATQICVTDKIPISSQLSGSMSLTIYLDRLFKAREKAAILVSQGEEWALPHFERLNLEIEILQKKENQLELAKAIARAALTKRQNV